VLHATGEVTAFYPEHMVSLDERIEILGLADISSPEAVLRHHV
jgi:hypothetical protein